jgi:hypothetical protein
LILQESRGNVRREYASSGNDRRFVHRLSEVRIGIDLILVIFLFVLFVLFITALVPSACYPRLSLATIHSPRLMHSRMMCSLLGLSLSFALGRLL